MIRVLVALLALLLLPVAARAQSTNTYCGTGTPGSPAFWQPCTGGGGGGGNVNINQVGGNTASTGSGAVGSGSLNVAVARDATTNAGSAPTPTGSAVPANSNYIAGSSSGNLTGVVVCDHHTFVHITSATDTLLVQGVTSQTVKMCGYKMSFAGTAAQTLFIENTASINANCSSAKTQIGPAVVGNASSPSSDGFYSAFWGGFTNTSGNGVCVNSTGTGAVDLELWYTQGS